MRRALRTHLREILAIIALVVAATAWSVHSPGGSTGRAPTGSPAESESEKPHA